MRMIDLLNAEYDHSRHKEDILLLVKYYLLLGSSKRDLVFFLLEEKYWSVQMGHDACNGKVSKSQLFLHIDPTGELLQNLVLKKVMEHNSKKNLMKKKSVIWMQQIMLFEPLWSSCNNIIWITYIILAKRPCYTDLNLTVHWQWRIFEEQKSAKRV